MKTLMISALVAALAVPAFADAASVRAKLALDNDSAAERIVGETSIGNVDAARAKFALDNDSAAERILNTDRNEVSRSAIEDAKRFFSQGNDSAAEIIN